MWLGRGWMVCACEERIVARDEVDDIIRPLELYFVKNICT